VPSLRSHVVFLNHVRDAAGGWAPPAGRRALVDALVDYWPEAVLGSLAPDAWPLFGGTRFQMHLLHKDDPATWDGAVERWLAWLAKTPDGGAAGPGRRAARPAAAFVLGYLSHLCLDTWSLYLDSALPPQVRARSPAAWFPPVLLAPGAAQATLRALGEAPIAADRVLRMEDIACAELPDGFPAEAIRRLAAGLVPALGETDPWRMSRINPLRPQPDTPAARHEWEQRRAAQPPVSTAARAALCDAALDFTRRAVEGWW
jgi:hypothetical protein